MKSEAFEKMLKDRGMKKSFLLEKLGISRQALWDYQHDKYQAPKDTIKCLALIFNIGYDEMNEIFRREKDDGNGIF
jgi:transcriptional regulator with XRE-family HTH domain